MRLRSLFLPVLVSVVLVPLLVTVGVATPAQAAGSTASSLSPVPMAGSPWRNSLTRRPVVRTVPVVVPVPVPDVPTTSPAQAYQDRVLVLTNAERTQRGLPALALSGCADGYANTWSGTLAGLGALLHQALSPILTTCGASSAGENVAYGNVTPEQLVAMWMNSAGHRDNILNARFSHIGVGATLTSTGRWYGVQVFIRL